MVTQNNSETAPVQNAEKKQQSFTEAMAVLNKQTFLSDDETFGPEEELSLGRGREINLNPERPIDIKTIKSKDATVKMRADKSSGIRIASEYLEEAFEDVDFAEIGHSKQLGLVLANGSVIFGWSEVAKNRRGMYIPKRKVPKGFPVPSPNRAKKVGVLSFIIG